MKKPNISGGIKQRMFTLASGRNVNDFLDQALKDRKADPSMTIERIADEMTSILKTKFPDKKISGQLVSLWIKQMQKGGRK